MASAIPYCYCQVFEENTNQKEPSKKTTKPAKQRSSSLTVIFQANHDFYFTVNDTRYKKVLKNSSREVKLEAGLYKLSFEEADSTGENVEHFFRVTDEMIKQGDSVYTVTFKDNFSEIERSFTGDPLKSRSEASPPNNKEDTVVNDLYNDMVPLKGGSFTMGSEEGVRVTISPFKFGKHEVTQLQWETIMGHILLKM
jgi:hypothetical protein